MAEGSAAVDHAVQPDTDIQLRTGGNALGELAVEQRPFLDGLRIVCNGAQIGFKLGKGVFRARCIDDGGIHREIDGAEGFCVDIQRKALRNAVGFKSEGIGAAVQLIADGDQRAVIFAVGKEGGGIIDGRLRSERNIGVLGDVFRRDHEEIARDEFRLVCIGCIEHGRRVDRCLEIIDGAALAALAFRFIPARLYME